MTLPGRPPPDQSFDARRLLGLREDAARREAKRLGCEIRVVRRDGQGLAVTGDFVAHRVDLEVMNGVVVRLAESAWTGYAPTESGSRR